MSFDDLFNSSFFLTITICSIMIALLYTYVSTKLNEQNHKLQTMVGLVSTMAQELEFMKMNKFSLSKSSLGEQLMSNFIPNNLIDVSDSGYNGEDGDHDDDDDDDDDDGDEDDDEDDDDDDDDDDEDEDNIDIDLTESKHVLEDDHLDIEEIGEHLHLNIDEINTNDIKVCNLSNITPEMASEIKSVFKQDLKKIKLPELKQMAQEKNPDLDISKLKKDELIQLLKS